MSGNVQDVVRNWSRNVKKWSEMIRILSKIWKVVNSIAGRKATSDVFTIESRLFQFLPDAIFPQTWHFCLLLIS